MRKSRRPWVCVLALAVLGAWPDVLFDRVADPILGSVGGELAVSGIEIAIAIAIGYVGGRERDWRITTGGALLMAAAIQVGTYIGRVLDSTSSEPASWNGLEVAAIELVMLLVPACLAHVAVISWSPRTHRTYCPRCGRKLTGNNFGRCPECGEAVERGT